MFSYQQYPTAALYDANMSNILVIDPDHHEVIRVILEQEGHTVYTALTVITPHLTKNIDILILDAGIDGFRLAECTAITGSTRGGGIPILVMSVVPALAVQAARAGATAFLEKPFEMSQFLDVVEQLIPAVSPMTLA